MTIAHIYAMHPGARCRVSRKGVQYWTWIESWAAGFVDYGAGAW